MRGSSGNSHSNNTAVGYIALQNVTTGNGNTALGNGAGTTVTTGGNNLCLGYGANVSTAAATNRIVIGYNASATADNSCFITNIYGTSLTNTGSSSVQVATVNSSGQLGSMLYEWGTYSPSFSGNYNVTPSSGLLRYTVVGVPGNYIVTCTGLITTTSTYNGAYFNFSLPFGSTNFSTSNQLTGVVTFTYASQNTGNNYGGVGFLEANTGATTGNCTFSYGFSNGSPSGSTNAYYDVSFQYTTAG